MTVILPPDGRARRSLRRLASSLVRASRPLFGPPAPVPGSGTSEAEYHAEADVGRKFSRGVAWNTTAKMSTRAIQFLVTIVLARLLVPADFGLAEMAAMVTMLVGMVAEFGFAHALIQKLEVTTEDVRTAMTLSIGMALILAAAGIATSGFIAGLFNAPSLRAPLAVACSGVVVAAVSITPRAMLMKRFDFRSIAMAEFAGCIVYGTAGIALALSGARVWSLVLAGIAMMVCQAVVLSVRSRCDFRPLLDRECARQLVPFGSRIFGANLIDYMRGNLDYLVIARALGAAPLGIYTIAFRISDFPRSRLVATVTEVAFSAMSAVQRDLRMLRRAYLHSLSMAALFAFPLLLGFTALAPEFVEAVYGRKWMGAVAPLRILMPMSLLLIVAQQGAILLVAKGEPGKYLRLGAGYAIAVGLAAAFGVRFGISGVAGAVMAATVVYFVASAVLIWRCAEISPLLTLRAVAIPSLAGLVMVAALLAYRASVPFPSDVRGLLWLLGAGLLGAAVYAAAALAGGAAVGAARDAVRWQPEREPAVSGR